MHRKAHRSHRRSREAGNFSGRGLARRRFHDYRDRRARFASVTPARARSRRESGRADRHRKFRRAERHLLWFCVPDARFAAPLRFWRIIWLLARLLDSQQKTSYRRQQSSCRLPLQRSAASRELEPLRKAGVAVASVHPLMTFVAGAHPSLTGVPFAIEGDDAATRVARRIVRELGGESFHCPQRAKAAYHAWATMTSPLLLAFLVTLEEAARAAGLTREDARRKSLPIIRQTLANYAPRSGAVFQRPAGSRRRGDGGETPGGAEEASRSARGLCGAGASRAARTAGEESEWR
jgi:hypothetical protein